MTVVIFFSKCGSISKACDDGGGGRWHEKRAQFWPPTINASFRADRIASPFPPLPLPFLFSFNKSLQEAKSCPSVVSAAGAAAGAPCDAGLHEPSPNLPRMGKPALPQPRFYRTQFYKLVSRNRYSDKNTCCGWLWSWYYPFFYVRILTFNYMYRYSILIFNTV